MFGKSLKLVVFFNPHLGKKYWSYLFMLLADLGFVSK